METIHTTLATPWHPHGRISISDQSEKGYLFEFYYAIDINRVIDGNPWTFNKHILVLHRLKSGEDPLRVPLYSVNYWVQIHDLTMILMSESMARQFGALLGSFVDYDAKLVSKGFGEYIQIRVQIDIQAPL
ncbi:hypothetical protein PVK06_027355 [Gossypium arboreum]|uniref:DUF4283 domain-containing protein n=1 Tax=Gossypium arboreum TaxID=29729 RepID=A0ABR0P019_GOSAR|nr:hypothetical protein PVK06_027355 [Gossypium arboreum]